MLEVKHLFELICPDDILLNKIITKIQEDDKGVGDYIHWLRHFGSFKSYIQFFCFDDFVDKQSLMPLDIVESELEWDNAKKEVKRTKEAFLEEPTKYKQRGTHSIFRLPADKLEQMLKNVSYLTLARSYRMQKVIGNQEKERHCENDRRVFTK